MTQELTDYVTHISQTLYELTNHNPKILDYNTMTLLEGRYPAISATDRLYIESVFHELFPLVQDPGLRGDLRRRVLGYPHMIPSLKLFLEDTKYLRPIMQLLRAAFCPPRFRGSIRDTLHRRYVEPPNKTFPIQTSANTYNDMVTAIHGYGFWSAYRQLCLFLMRNFFGMSNCLPRGVHKYRGPHKQPDTHELWKQFTQLSEKLGFGTPRCPYRRDTDKRPHEYLAIYSLLRSLRPPDSFDYDDTVLVDISTKTCEALNKMREKPTMASTPSLAMESRSEFCIATRCGMTDIESFFADQKHLYLPNMYNYDYAAGPYLTSFAIKRNMFLCFFGTTVPSDVLRDGAMDDVPQNENFQPGIVEPSVGPPVSQLAIEPAIAPESGNGELILASQAEDTEMKMDALIEITNQNPDGCVCKVDLESTEFAAYFIRTSQRTSNLYYLYNPLDKILRCTESMHVLAGYRDNTTMVALLKPNLEVLIDHTLHNLEHWKRNELYVLFPDSFRSQWRKGMFTQSTISDSNFARMGLPIKLPSQMWVIEPEVEEL